MYDDREMNEFIAPKKIEASLLFDPTKNNTIQDPILDYLALRSPKNAESSDSSDDVPKVTKNIRKPKRSTCSSPVQKPGVFSFIRKRGKPIPQKPIKKKKKTIINFQKSISETEKSVLDPKQKPSTSSTSSFSNIMYINRALKLMMKSKPSFQTSMMVYTSIRIANESISKSSYDCMMDIKQNMDGIKQQLEVLQLRPNEIKGIFKSALEKRKYD